MLLRRRYLSFERRSHQKREDMEVIEVKDYIANPKRNGYKSLHMIIKYPLSLNSGTKDVFAEIQLRTLAMDFWASLEHKLYYKYEGKIPEYLKMNYMMHNES